jgi:DNA-binding CsgD family transcriptional regulator
VRDAVEIWARRASHAKAPRLPALRLPNGVRLSHMEQEVLAFIVAGAPNAEVAEALDITRQSVANHRWRITKKLGAGSSTDLVRIVLCKSQAQSAALG